MSRLLVICTTIAFASLIAVGMMSEDAMAQTEEIKIGVLSAFPPIYEAGPNRAMELARDAWNHDAIPEINTEVKLEFIDIKGNFTSPDYPEFLAQQIRDAAQRDYTHFVAPSDDTALALVQSVTGTILPNSILVSPASQLTFPPSLHADDNLFRLVPNSLTQAENLLEYFDNDGIHTVIIITDIGLKTLVDSGNTFPDDSHGHYLLPSYAIYGPEYEEQNVQSLTALDSKLTELLDQNGGEGLAIFAAMQPQSFVTMANVLAANPELDAVYDLEWFGYNYLGHSPFITSDETAAKFADDVDMSVIVYEISRNDINAPLYDLPAFSPSFRNFNFASYDAVHLLADAIAIGGADNSNLKDVIYDVANNEAHAVPHTDRILGVGASGDYTLDTATGDVIESRSYVEYQVIKSGDGYVWSSTLPNVNSCRN